MKKSFMTNMPDTSGAFLQAARTIFNHGGNITRASYNKAVDMHTLFVDVEGDEQALKDIEAELEGAGYLSHAGQQARIVLMEAELIDRPGAIIPVLDAIRRYNINISYMSIQVLPTAARQSFKMGLSIREPGMISTLLEELSRLCPVRILHYDAGEKTLDNTVFYLNFASDMRRLLRLTQAETNEFIYYSNLVMQQLDERNEPPSKTFEYISRFARFVVDHGSAGYDCRLTCQRLTPRVVLTVLEPPCGSNIAVLEDGPGGPLLVVDSGFTCHRRYALRKLRELFPEFDTRPKALLLTHSDADHAGLSAEFGVIYCSQRTADCFVLEAENQPIAREINRKSLPYYRLCKLITQYRPPMLSQLHILNTCPGDDTQPLSVIGHLDFADMHFDVYQGNSGHVPGETLLFDEEHKVAITGDDYVNHRNYTPEQQEFNRFAPYLMTSVNEDSVKARAILHELRRRMDGQGWVILPGHGAVLQRDQPM